MKTYIITKKHWKFDFMLTEIEQEAKNFKTYRYYYFPNMNSVAVYLTRNLKHKDKLSMDSHGFNLTKDEKSLLEQIMEVWK